MQASLSSSSRKTRGASRFIRLRMDVDDRGHMHSLSAKPKPRESLEAGAMMTKNVECAQAGENPRRIKLALWHLINGREKTLCVRRFTKTERPNMNMKNFHCVRGNLHALMDVDGVTVWRRRSC